MIMVRTIGAVPNSGENYIGFNSDFSSWSKLERILYFVNYWDGSRGETKGFLDPSNIIDLPMPMHQP